MIAGSTPSNVDDAVATLKRPHMEDFLAAVYCHYDIVIWSQTSWKWVEIKLTELGFLTSTKYRIHFVLDKTSMLKLSTGEVDAKTGESIGRHVKPLKIIWSKMPRYGPNNTVAIDDLERNFLLNQGEGIKCTGYYRKKKKARQDNELVGLACYLTR